VRREARNGNSTFELGYLVAPGVTSGVRFVLGRNRDLIGIRQENSIRRDQEQYSAFTRFNRRWAGLPVTASANFGHVNDRQPEYSRAGEDVAFDAATKGTLPGNASWTLDANLRTSRLASKAPSDTGLFESEDRNSDRAARAGVSWAPKGWINVDVRGSTRRGVLERPEPIIDSETLEQVVAQEEVVTRADNGELSVRWNGPGRSVFTSRASISDTQIEYDVDSTRSNIATAQSFNLTAQKTVYGANVNASFQNGTTESDYTRRSDGYLQRTWRRVAEITANRRLGLRLSGDARGNMSLDSRRYDDFRPSSGSSFPPSDQDLLRAVGGGRVDYRLSSQITTGLDGQIDYNRTINLASTSSINNTDQIGYAITWRWAATPWSFWTVSQNNSAGAQDITYPFAASRDQLSFIYQLRTSSVARLTKQVNFETHYSLRYQSRGSYRTGTDLVRRFGKTGGSDQFDLLLRLNWIAAKWLSLDVSQQTIATENYSLSSGTTRIDTESRRDNLFANAVTTLPVGKTGSFSFTLRRVLTRDWTQTNATPRPAPTVREDSYWQANLAFRTAFTP
jgi:hypothetical protein